MLIWEDLFPPSETPRSFKFAAEWHWLQTFNRMTLMHGDIISMHQWAGMNASLCDLISP